MDLKYKVRTYNFWISLAAAILIVLRLLGQYFGFVVDSNLFMDIATAVCGVLVILGIIIMPASAQNTTKTDKSKQKTVKTDGKTDKIAEETSTEDKTETETEKVGETSAEDDKTTAQLSTTVEDETEIDKTQQEETDKEDAAEQISMFDTESAKQEIGAKVDEMEETQLAVKTAIEQLANNPNELYALVREILKNRS